MRSTKGPVFVTAPTISSPDKRGYILCDVLHGMTDRKERRFVRVHHKIGRDLVRLQQTWRVFYAVRDALVSRWRHSSSSLKAQIALQALYVECYRIRLVLLRGIARLYQIAATLSPDSDLRFRYPTLFVEQARQFVHVLQERACWEPVKYMKKLGLDVDLEFLGPEPELIEPPLLLPERVVITMNEERIEFVFS
ncbi:hypothetical protein PUNSTDRAFT_136643 [Punctularia strigosozonata HHB-11173 SS5]|uniref:uncharacterized protein n=1 Tax=Punctularia strigosozonata (strain HHB-11173) TaxID=741275 RepID=UPI0004416CB7|nr:uncharacterized protein PUNSTDRAFT_136643 [Punctularia strigosozonata HHB-11173 SS5]EIN06812.1 hypothetical protein PUNSTDRAFT_136643 [Punctularia strigosozonata HHB-11173 SS5]